MRTLNSAEGNSDRAKNYWSRQSPEAEIYFQDSSGGAASDALHGIER